MTLFNRKHGASQRVEILYPHARNINVRRNWPQPGSDVFFAYFASRLDRNPSTCYWVDLANGNFSEAAFDSRGSIFSEAWTRIIFEFSMAPISHFSSFLGVGCLYCSPSFKSRTHALRCILTSLLFLRMILQLSASAAGLVMTGTRTYCHRNLRAHPQRYLGKP